MYDFYNYNDPLTKCNKHVYAYGEDENVDLTNAGIIHADNKKQAQTVLNANNRAWIQDNILLDVKESDIIKEYEKRLIRRMS